MSTTFVFARFEGFPFRHELLPILFRFTPPSNFLKFESGKMGVALVLNKDASVSAGGR